MKNPASNFLKTSRENMNRTKHRWVFHRNIELVLKNLIATNQIKPEREYAKGAQDTRLQF